MRCDKLGILYVMHIELSVDKERQAYL